MFKKPSKKQLLIRRIIFSIIATLAVLIIVTATVLSMMGFRLDSHNGRLEQGVLLQFDSAPNGASVWIDGADTGARTASKRTLIAGTHTVTILKDKYEAWNRTLTLQPGTLTWLSYVRLVPKERVPQVVARYGQLAQLEFSPDRRFAVAHDQAHSPAFTIIDLRGEEIKTTSLTLPPELYADAAAPGEPHTFTIERWNPSGRYILVKHAYADTQEWLVVDTENGAQSNNITRSLNLAMTDIRFAGSNGKHFYALTDDGTIRKLDLSAGTISRALVTHAQQFSVFDTTVVSYVGKDPEDEANKVAGVYREGDEVPHVLRRVSTPETELRIAAGKYYNNDIVAIAEGKKVTILRGSYPGSNTQDVSSLRTYASFELAAPVTQLGLSPAGDIVLAQAGETFASYEIEHRRLALDGKTTLDAAQADLRWIDGAYLWNITEGKLMLRDFDNANVYAIASATAGYGASLSTNGRFLYMVQAAGGEYQLQRVRMLLN